MKRARWLVLPVLALAAWYLFRPAGEPPTEGEAMKYPVEKTDAEWRAQLTPEQYRVTRGKGTERAFTGEYWNCKADGVYHCVCCGQPLFDAHTKYESGTGWPSFWQPISPESVAQHEDNSWMMRRTEVVCSRCGAHLGHVFEDGPAPTGLRYCMNSAALRLEKRGPDEPKEAGKEGK